MINVSKAALSKKIFFLGIDGMDPDLTKYFIEKGMMPHTKEFIKRGSCRDDLHMLGGVPTITPPMWATLATGCSPNVHGISCFWLQSHEKLDELVYAFGSDKCKAETLWEVTAQAGLKTMVFHWPSAAWPARIESDNLHMIDGTTPAPINMGVHTIEAEKIFIAANDISEIRFQAKVAVENGAGCVLGDLADESASERTLSEKSTTGHNLVNYEMSFNDGEGSFESMQIDMYNSPIYEPHGWVEQLPEGAKEFIAGASKGLERRYGLIIPNEQGVYDRVQLYQTKKSAQPLVELTREDYIKYEVVDTITQADGTKKKGAGFFALMDLAQDGSYVRVYMGPLLDIAGDSHFRPQSLYHELTEHFGYIICPTQTGGQYADITEKVILPTWKYFMTWQANALNYLMTEKDYQVVFSHMHNIDALGHQFWHWSLQRKRNPEADPALYAEFMEECYRDTDEYIGQFLHLLDEDWTIFLFSDHGFLTNKEEEPPVLGDPFGINVPILEQLGYTVLKDPSKRKSGEVEIDWAKTRAVAARGNNIYLNLKGKYATGIVEEKDKYALEEKIIDDLYNYRDPLTKRRIVYMCMRNKDAKVLGIGGEEYGDIIYWLNEGFNRGHGDSLPGFTGEHHTSVSPIFIAAGQGIKSGFVTERAIREMDVTPTAAYLLGVRMPHQCEGAVVYQIIDESDIC